MVRLIKIFLYFLVLLGLAGVVHAATIKVTLDRDVVSLNDSFTIVFQATGSVDDTPDFSPLDKDFEILSKQQRSNLTIINGKSTSSTEWLVEVMAKRVGVLTIPAISFGNDQSQPIQITVKHAVAGPSSAQPDDDIFIEVEASPTNNWVQAQIIYTIRLFRSVNTFNSSLSEPRISGGKFIVEKLEDRQFETSRGGRRYMVLQRRYAIFPQASGKFTIEPIVFTGLVSRRSRHLFDPFGRNSSTIRRFSRPINLEIKPIPPDYGGRTWLPAKNLQISEKWLRNDLELVAGEPVTRVISIKADGLTGEQLPEIGVQDLKDFKIYPDQPEIHNQSGQDGLLGVRQEKSAVIPLKPGKYVLPALKVTWWNIQTNKEEVAVLPERVIDVLPGATGNQATQSAPSETKPNDEVTTESSDPVGLPERTAAGYWPWISLVLALGWLTTVLFWWRSQSGKNEQTVTETRKGAELNERATLHQLREAVRKNDPRSIQSAMLAWAQSVWKDDPPASLAAIGERCGQPMADELARLNRYLYADPDQKWDGERLLLAVENFDSKTLLHERGACNTGLEPLYPIG